jgi:hypothetical protein
VYGGAGVHVSYLARELAGLVDLTVHCQGADRPGAVAHQPWDLLAGANPALRTISADLSMTAAVGGADLVHSHTWYANLAGHLASLLYGIPHVATVHSLEPLRPWKAEQLGGGYALSSWCERVAVESAAAVVAVSDGMRGDVLAAYPAVPPERIRVTASIRCCLLCFLSGGLPGRRDCRYCCGRLPAWRRKHSSCYAPGSRTPPSWPRRWPTWWPICGRPGPG